MAAAGQVALVTGGTSGVGKAAASAAFATQIANLLAGASS